MCYAGGLRGFLLFFGFGFFGVEFVNFYAVRFQRDPVGAVEFLVVDEFVDGFFEVGQGGVVGVYG